MIDKGVSWNSCHTKLQWGCRMPGNRRGAASLSFQNDRLRPYADFTPLLQKFSAENAVARSSRALEGPCPQVGQ